MRFSKMHGLGNDFMIVDAITQNVSFSSNVVRYLSDRHCGVGFDQLLLVEPPYEPDVDFHYRIFNADGREVSQCGNGVRCLGRFVHMKKLTNKLTICVSTQNRRMILFISDQEICVDMGKPIFDPRKIPFCAKKIKDSYLIRVVEKEILCGVVSMGNPHCILVVDDVKNAQVSVLGPTLENHRFFPEQANISFMEVVSDKHIRLRVYERGMGETQSCGSAACAAVSVGIRQGLLCKRVQVDLLGGSLFVNWNGIGHSVYMHGPATHVYDGRIYL